MLGLSNNSLLLVLSLSLIACNPPRTTRTDVDHFRANIREQTNTLRVAIRSDINTLKSTKNTLQQLQHDSDNYPYSHYIKSNLKAPQSNTVQVSPYPTTRRKFTRRSNRQHQLPRRKNRSRTAIQAVILHNGLYTPTQATQQKTATLGSKLSTQLYLEQHSDLATVLALVLKHNLDIKTQQHKVLSRLAQYDQVQALDDMLAQYAAFTHDISLTGSRQQPNKPVNKSFPFPALTSLKASIIDQSIEIARLKLKQTVQNVLTQARTAYYELQYLQQEVDLTRQNARLLKLLQEELQNNYTTNSSGLNEVLQVEIEREENRNSLLISKNKQLAQSARLNALLNLPTTFKLTRLDPLKPSKLPQSLQYLLTKAKDKRVEIALLRAELAKMQRIIRLSKKRFYPNLDAGYSRFQNRTLKQVGSNAKQATFTNRPQLKKNNFFANNDAYLKETQLNANTLAAKIKALHLKTEDDLLQAYTQYQTQKNHYTLYHRKILPKATAVLTLAKSNFEAGEGGLAQIIDAQRLLLNYRLLASKAMAGMNLTLAKLKRIKGSD